MITLTIKMMMEDKWDYVESVLHLNIANRIAFYWNCISRSAIVRRAWLNIKYQTYESYYTNEYINRAIRWAKENDIPKRDEQEPANVPLLPVCHSQSLMFQHEMFVMNWTAPKRVATKENKVLKIWIPTERDDTGSLSPFHIFDRVSLRNL